MPENMQMRNGKIADRLNSPQYHKSTDERQNHEGSDRHKKVFTSTD